MQCMLLFQLGNTHLWIHLVFVCFIGRILSECLCQWYQLAFIRIHSQFLKFHQTGNKLSFQLSCISLWRERRVSPGHESSNPGPFAFCDEETDHRIGHSTPDFTDEQHHGGLEGVNLRSATGTRWNSQAHISIPAHFFHLWKSLPVRLPEQRRAGRFAGRILWRWQPLPWARRRWQNTICCIATTSGSGRSGQTDVRRDKMHQYI